MKKKLKKYEIGGIDNSETTPKSFEEWVKEQDLPPGADPNMLKSAYETYLKNFGQSNSLEKIGDQWKKINSSMAESTKDIGQKDNKWGKFFTDFNNVLSLTQFVGGTINDIRQSQDERKRLLEAQYPKSGFNVNQQGVNNIPVYYQKGGEVNNDAEMVNGIADILAQVKDRKNRAEIAKNMIGDFKHQDVQYNYEDFMRMSKLQRGGLPTSWLTLPAKIKNLFGFSEDDGKTAPKPAKRIPEFYKIVDKRKNSLTTGKPIDPNSEILTDEYYLPRMLEIAKAAKRYEIDPYLAIAMDLQETGLGNRSDQMVGHSTLNFNELIPTKMGSEEESDDFDIFARSIATKLKYADKLGIKDELRRIQAYNGLGRIYPETEQNYHGFKMDKIYGVPVPKEGIDMRKNPLYGKRIVDIRDNILKQDKLLNMYLGDVKKTGGPVSVKKAKEILKDGTIHGRPLTEKQRGYFGFIAGGGKPKMGMGGNNPYVNSTGYLDGAATSQNPYNIIPSNVITMQGVSQDVTAYPVGKYGIGAPVNMKANNPTDYFFPNAEYVAEVPSSGNSLGYMQKGGKKEKPYYEPNWFARRTSIPGMLGAALVNEIPWALTQFYNIGKDIYRSSKGIKSENMPFPYDPFHLSAYMANRRYANIPKDKELDDFIARLSPEDLKQLTVPFKKGGEMCEMCGGKMPCKCGGKVKMQQGGEMYEDLEEMATGGIPQRYKNMGFTKVGVKKKSNRSGKKWMVLAKKGDKYKVVHGGYVGMQDYTQHGSEKRRKNFWNRMGGKNSAKATDPFSPLYWHKRFGTWQEGGQVNEEQMAQQELMGVLQEFAQNNNMTLEQLLAKLEQLPKEQMQQAIDDIIEDVAETRNGEKEIEPEEPEQENGQENEQEPEVEVEEMGRGGYKMYQQGGDTSFFDALVSATKVASPEQDFKFIGERDNRKYYGKTTQDLIGNLAPAKRTPGAPGKPGKAYDDFVIGLLQKGYSPQQLVDKGYISQEGANQFGRYYVEPQSRSQYVYTEPSRQPAPQQTFEGENIFANNKALGKVAFKFRDAQDADVQAGIVPSMKDPVKEYYFRKYKPNTGEIDYASPMYKIPSKDWYNLTSGTTHLSNADLLEKYKMQEFKTGGIQQMGGVPRYEANAELEKGEVYQDQSGMIKKVAESEPTHEDGGSPQPNVHKVLEDTADKRRDLDSRLLKIKPDEAEYIVGFRPKGSTTHSKLFEQATQFYDKKAKSLEKKIKQNYEYVKYSGGGKYAQNSLDENLKMLAQLPTKSDLFDIIYNHQEEVKGRYGIGQEEQMRLGGLRKYQTGTTGQNFVESKNISPSWQSWAPLNTPYIPSWVEQSLFTKSNTPAGGISATTGASTLYDSGVDNVYSDYSYWRKIYGKEFEGPQQYQDFVFSTLFKYDPNKYYDIIKKWGMPAAGRLDDEYFGARTGEAARFRIPDMPSASKITPLPGTETKKPPTTETKGYDEPGGSTTSRFNEPLRWYDVAGTTAAYLSALEREPVALEQLSMQPIQARLLNPLPAMEQTKASFNAALRQMPTSGVGMANIANLLGNKYSADNQVLGQYENINKQNLQQVDTYNQQKQLALDQANLNLRDVFNQRVLAAKEVQRQSKLNAFDDFMTKIAQNRKLNREGDLTLQMTPYFDQYGRFNGNLLGITKTAESLGGSVTTKKTADGKTQYTVLDKNGNVIRSFNAK